MLQTGNMLLRKMALKSIIGFGDYADHSVHELMITEKHADLIRMYYMLDKIDYNDEVKKMLGITGDRVIAKPGKDKDMYYANIRAMIGEIIQAKQPAANDPNKWRLFNLKKANKRDHEITVNKIENWCMKKIVNRSRNQK